MHAENKIDITGLTAAYGGKYALKDITLAIPRNEIFGIIGPSNSGKTTLLKCINRTIELTAGASVRGSIAIDGEEIFRRRNVHGLGPRLKELFRLRNAHDLRRRIGMVFPLPVGLPITVFDNVAYAPRLAGIHVKAELEEIVERCLRQAALWDEVKDRLHTLGTRLSGGQQQRLTIARALSHDPEILCLDEFSIAIDPVTTMRIEDVLLELKTHMTIILVTNLVQQARRLASRTAFFNKGAVVQVDATDVMFSDNPGNRLTYEYVHGIFG